MFLMREVASAEYSSNTVEATVETWGKGKAGVLARREDAHFHPPKVADSAPASAPTASAMSLEIVGPERLSVSRSVTVAAKGIQKLESSPVIGGKLEGCLGASVGALLAKVVGDCGDGVSGVFEAEDGAKTDPIEMSELVQGTIIHSDASGGALTQKQGGPLRVSFPEGVAVQESMCGTAKPVNIKFAVRLTLSSHFELKDARLARQLCAAAPRFILGLAACPEGPWLAKQPNPAAARRSKRPTSSRGAALPAPDGGPSVRGVPTERRRWRPGAPPRLTRPRRAVGHQ